MKVVLPSAPSMCSNKTVLESPVCTLLAGVKLPVQRATSFETRNSSSQPLRLCDPLYRATWKAPPYSGNDGSPPSMATENRDWKLIAVGNERSGYETGRPLP